MKSWNVTDIKNTMPVYLGSFFSRNSEVNMNIFYVKLLVSKRTKYVTPILIVHDLQNKRWDKLEELELVGQLRQGKNDEKDGGIFMGYS